MSQSREELPRTKYAVDGKPVLGMMARHADRWFITGTDAGLRVRGTRPVTLTQLEIFHHLDDDGLSIAEIARRCSIARQSAHQTITELVNRGMLRIEPDPNSDRSKLVRTTELTDAHMRSAMKVSLACEYILADRIGRDSVERLRGLLDADWGPTLDVDDWKGAPGRPLPEDAEPRFQYLVPHTKYAIDGNPLLAMRIRRTYRWLLAGSATGMAAHHATSLTFSQLEVFHHVDAAGLSIAELARRSGVARQSTHQAVNELSRAGMLTIEPDPNSGRNKLVRTTDYALECIRIAQEVMIDVEQKLAERIGRDKVELLRDILAEDWGPPPTVDDDWTTSGS